jgi:hypothetical protein
MPTGTNLGVQQSDILHKGHITTAGGPTDTSSYVVVVSGEGASTWVADMRGTFSAGTTLVFEVTVDGQNWVPDAGTQVGSVTPALTTTVNGPGPLVYTGSVAALQQFRVRATGLAFGDDVTVTLRLSVGVGTSISSGGGGGGGTVYQGTIPWVVAGQGTAGAPAAGVVSVQGVTGGTPVDVVSGSQPFNAQEDPNTGAQTNNLSSSGGVPLTTPTTTACTYSALGGEFYLRMLPASENLLGVFAYQVPVGFTLYVTNVVMPSPLVVQQFAGTPAGLMWELFVASSANPATATGVRFPLLTFGAVEGQRAGSNLSGGGIAQLFPQAPVIVAAGSWVLICYKVIGVGSNTGAFRGTCSINGYFQPV